MQPRILSRRTPLLVVLIGFIFFAVLAFYDIKQRSRQPATKQAQSVSASLNENAPATSSPEPPTAPVEMRLKIPKINVDALVEPLGLTPEGAMEAPVGGQNVGWYKFGSRPGEAGSAVFDGHYGRWKNGQGSVFDDLSTLKPGDTLSVDDENGVTTTFVVRESRSYEPNADASDVFGASDDKVHLNLITCEGIWDKTKKSYSSRLVVFADKQ